MAFLHHFPSGATRIGPGGLPGLSGGATRFLHGHRVVAAAGGGCRRVFGARGAALRAGRGAEGAAEAWRKRRIWCQVGNSWEIHWKWFQVGFCWRWFGRRIWRESDGKIMIIMCVYEVRMILKILARIERFFSRNLWLKCFFVAVENSWDVFFRCQAWMARAAGRVWGFRRRSHPSILVSGILTFRRSTRASLGCPARDARDGAVFIDPIFTSFVARSWVLRMHTELFGRSCGSCGSWS